ncbi:hypothetical protein BANRA_03798 [Acinetobacter baumannii]|nr:hypothetical protein BANRA_03798 [Acinetobacter baumannii]
MISPMRIERSVWKTANIIEIGHTTRQGIGLRRGLITVERDGNAICLERVQHRRDTRDFCRTKQARRRDCWMPDRGRSHLPLGHQLTRLRNGCVWRQIPASIGETVRGYVDDAENDERFIHGASIIIISVHDKIDNSLK